MMPMQGMMPPSGGGGGMPSEEGGESPEAVRAKLIQLLKQIERIAQDNGINFQEIIDEFTANRGSAATAPPPPPMGMV